MLWQNGVAALQGLQIEDIQDDHYASYFACTWTAAKAYSFDG